MFRRWWVVGGGHRQKRAHHLSATNCRCDSFSWDDGLGGKMKKKKRKHLRRIRRFAQPPKTPFLFRLHPAPRLVPPGHNYSLCKRASRVCQRKSKHALELGPHAGLRAALLSSLFLIQAIFQTDVFPGRLWVEGTSQQAEPEQSSPH